MLRELVKLAKTLIDAAMLWRDLEAIRVARREAFRIERKAEQRKLRREAVELIDDAVAPMFKAQYDSAAKKLRTATGDTADKLLKQIFNPRAWDDELIDRAFPAVAETMLVGAKSSLAAVGVRLRDGGKDTQTESKRPDTPSTLREKASTATEWLESQGTTLPTVLTFDSPDGPIDISLATEYPDWLKDKIGAELDDTFSQDYWAGMNDTTKDRLHTILDSGLKNGKSIATMASEISGLGDSFSKQRGKLIGRTEAAHALNGGRNASIEGLKEELPPAAAKHIGKSWLSVLGDTTRDTHANLDGKLADEEGMWLLGGVRVPWPGHTSLPVGERANCQCSILTEVGIGAPESEIQAIINEQAGVLTGAEKPKTNELASLNVPKDMTALADKKVSQWAEAVAKKEGLKAEDVLKSANASLKESIKKADVYVRVDGGVVDSILKEGRFKTQFETGKSGGVFNPENRKAVEHLVMGVEKNIPVKDRPIYGYLSSEKPSSGYTKKGRWTSTNHGTTGFYGDTVVKLKAGVRDRATFSLQDSFGDINYSVASPISDPNIRSMNVFAATDEVSDMPKFLMTKKVDDVRIYAEAHIHKGLIVDDIESMTFRAKPSGATEKLLKEKGISWEVIE